MPISSQTLPSAGPARELLREKGQFWTPDWIADAMVAYVLHDGATEIFDPAVGAGAFFRAGRRVAARLGRRIALKGTELDAMVLQQARKQGVPLSDLQGVELRDFLLQPPRGSLPAIVGNPPYIRHHRLAPELKVTLRAFSARLLGIPLDGRAGLHVYFLLQALCLLAPGGRLAFIMPADTCEGVYAGPLWRWIAQRYRIEHVIAFAPAATPFPLVDTNAVVFMIRHAPPRDRLVWTLCLQPGTDDLARWALSGFRELPNHAVAIVHERQLCEALAIGLSRPPRAETPTGAVLSDFAVARRGIATGANGFFFLTRARARQLGLPESFFVTAIGRTRDVNGDEICPEHLDALDERGRPTRLLSLDGQPHGAFPPAVGQYLRYGEQLGLPMRPLIAQRRPWYKMESRQAPAFLFAYLGRRNARFIRNTAGVVPLTGFLCIYPRRGDPTSLQELWSVLRHPLTTANLSQVGKSYGGGAIKVEPRALERLPIPAEALAEAGMPTPDKAMQSRLLW